MKQILIFTTAILASLQLFSQSVNIRPKKATIENKYVSIEFDLTTGTYSGIDKSNNTIVFKDAQFLVDPGLRKWKVPEMTVIAEEINYSKGKQLRIWFTSLEGYHPVRFLDLTLIENKSSILIGWGIKNDFEYEVRVMEASVLHQGKLFEGQKISKPKVLRGGAGAEPNFVEDTWKINALNSAMLTYKNLLANNDRRTIVAGGNNYNEFLRRI